MMSNSPSPVSSSSSSYSSATTRLWRPAAQRNIRNQWSKLANCRQLWLAASSSGRSHATSLVNAYLSQKYMPSMELGALSGMPDIRKKASEKLFKQQISHRSNLLSSYKDMVGTVAQMVNASRSMRCFLKTSSSPLLQFSSSSEDTNDAGDGGGVCVYTFLSMSSFEELAEELVHMFRLEVLLKRLIVMELSLNCEVPQTVEFNWSNELYPGEFDRLSACNLYSLETREPDHPRLRHEKPNMPFVMHESKPTRESLQAYLTTWLAEVNIDAYRVDEIFAIAGEEMHVTLS